MADRITHMLVLVANAPDGSEREFVQKALAGCQDDAGGPYTQLMDANTKVHVMVVGDEVFGIKRGYDSGSHFRAVWNRTPDPETLHYRFLGSVVTIAEHEEGSPDPQNMRDFVRAACSGELDTVKQLLANGADPNARENSGAPTDATALMRAAERGHMEIVKLLIEKGADVNATWNVGGAALAMVAGNAGTAEMMRFLIQHGADVNARDQYGQTALTAAAVYDRVDNVRLLLDSGAQVNAKKSDGTTALTGAVQYGNTETVKLLLERGATVDASPRNRETEQLMALAKKPEIAALLMAAAREQFMKAGNTQASPSTSKPTAAASRHPRPASPVPERPVAKEQQASKKWWQFWK